MPKFRITKLRLYRPNEGDEPFIEYIVGTSKLEKHFVESIDQMGNPKAALGMFKINLEGGNYLLAGGFPYVIQCETV